MSKIIIIDYGLGNLASIANALRRLNISFEVSPSPDTIKKARALILPGVGAAGQGMQNLRAASLDKAIIEQANRGVPILGVCLGMQLLLSRSEEGSTECLGLVPGSVKRFQAGLKVPHIGWNQVKPARETPLLQGVPPDSYFYFAHSYYCMETTESCVGATSYGMTFCSALSKQNIFGVQFHPEKSSDVGLRLLRNFWELADAG